MEKKRIERLVKVRERLLDARRAELADADRALRDANEAEERAKRIENETIAKLADAEELSGADLQQAALLALKAVEETSEAHAVVVLRSDERAERQQAVFDAKKDVKVLEAIETRIVERIRADDKRREQSAMDEAAAQGRNRGMAKEPAEESRDEARSNTPSSERSGDR